MGSYIKISVPEGVAATEFLLKIQKFLDEQSASKSLKDTPPEVDFVDLLVDFGLVQDRLEGVRLIESGRVYLGDNKVRAGDTCVDSMDMDYKIVFGYLK